MKSGCDRVWETIGIVEWKKRIDAWIEKREFKD